VGNHISARGESFAFRGGKKKREGIILVVPKARSRRGKFCILFPTGGGKKKRSLTFHHNQKNLGPGETFLAEERGKKSFPHLTEERKKKGGVS